MDGLTFDSKGKHPFNGFLETCQYRNILPRLPPELPAVCLLQEVRSVSNSKHLRSAKAAGQAKSFRLDGAEPNLAALSLRRGEVWIFCQMRPDRSHSSNTTPEALYRLVWTQDVDGVSTSHFWLVTMVTFSSGLGQAGFVFLWCV